MKIIDNKPALVYFKSVGSMLKDDVELLKDYLGISEFGYLKMFFDNRYFYVSSDPKMIEDYVKYVKDTIIFYDKTLPTQNGYHTILWPEHPNHYSMELYTKHKHWNGITILNKSKEFVEMYWFTAGLDDPLAGDYYIRNTNVLIAFMQHWMSKNRNRLNLDDPRILATFVDGVDFSNMDKIELDKEVEQRRIKKFLEVIRSGGVNVQTISGEARLTPRELECLHLLSKGNIVKEIARELEISHRTVEGHINNVRSKVGFLYKSDLVKLYKEQVPDLEI